MPVIRLASEADAGAIAAIYRPAVAESATSFEIDPPDAAELARRIASILAAYPWIVLTEEHEVRGYAYASAHRQRAAYRWTVETSAYVDRAHHRRGFGRALYGSLFEILKAQRYAGACAGITLPNDASVRLHRAMGFEPVGVYHAVGWKFGRWHDVLWLERRIAEATPEPPEPVPLPQLELATLDRIFSAGLDGPRISPRR